MKIWKRAVLYLMRKKNRSVLILLIIFMMGSLLIVGNAMRQSAEDDIQRIRQNLASSFTVAIDSENMALYEERYDKSYTYSVFIGKTITDQLIDEISNVEGIIDYEVNEFEIVWTALQLRPGSFIETEPRSDFSLEQIDVFQHTTNAILCRNGNANVNFRIGAFDISDGRNIKPDDEGVVVLSEYLAEENGITVGDTITLETKRGNYEPTDVPYETLGVPVDLTVIGIFHINFEQQASIFTAESGYAENLLFVDQKTVQQLNDNLEVLFPEQQKYDEVTFFVNDPESLSTVMERVEEQVDLSDLIVSIDDSAYQASVEPLQQISIFATVLMIIAGVGGLIILYLILMLQIKERRREIGIYLSIGIRKKNILCQMALEYYIILFISIILSYASAPIITNEIFHAVSEMTATEEPEGAYDVRTSNTSLLPTIIKVASEPVDLTYHFSAGDFIVLAVVTLSVSSVSVAVAGTGIKKITPKILLQSK